MKRLIAAPLALTATVFASSAVAETLAEAHAEASADAQSDDDTGSARTKRLGQVQVTATRRAEPAMEVPTPITVIGADEIRERAQATPMEALRGETGVFVQQTTPGQSIVIVRGLKGSEVLHLVDGFRLNNAIFRNSPNQYMALVDGEMLDRIEIVRGPMSTLYGSDAMGGVVQMLSWDPRFDAPGHQVRVRTSYRSADEDLAGRIEAAAGDERWTISGGATYHDVGEREIGGGRTLPFTEFTSRAGDAKIVFKPADGHELLFSAQYYDQPSTPRHDELVPGFGQTNPTSVEFRFEPQVRRFAHARYRTTAPTALYDLAEVHVGRQTIRDDRNTREFNTNNLEAERNTVETDGVTLQADKSFGDNTLTYGAEWYHDDVFSFRERINVASGAVTARPSRFPDGSTMRQLGVFAVHDWRFGDGWDLNTGLRYTKVNTNLPPVIGGIGVDLDNDDVSGNIGIAKAISETVRIVANAGRGFRAPNVFDLGVFGDRPSNRFSIPNSNLEPETVNTFDLGVKFAGERWIGEAFVFRSTYHDKITSVLTGDVTESGRLIVQNRNVTRQEVEGIETGVRYQWNEALALYGTATYTRGDEKVDGATDPADRIPPLAGKLGAEWAPRSDLRFDGYFLYATDQDRLSPRDEVDPRINPDGTAGWVTANARVRWQPIDDVELGFGIENLADKRYREHGTGLDSPGRSAVVTVDWRF